MKKTNAMRFLDQKKIKYEVIEYDIDGQFKSAKDVCEKLDSDPSVIFKTLVTKSKSNEIYVFTVSAADNLDFKKASAIVKEKSLEMVKAQELKNLTGYVRGGCTPLGMKKNYPIYADKKILTHKSVFISGGKPGLQIKIDPSDLIDVSNAKVAELCDD